MTRSVLDGEYNIIHMLWKANERLARSALKSIVDVDHRTHGTDPVTTFSDIADTFQDTVDARLPGTVV